MSPKKKRLNQLLLTRHDISNLQEIETHSVQQWGKRAAAKYLNDIETSLQLIQANPAVLTAFEGVPEELQCYRVNRHLLVCDVRRSTIVVLTVLHCSMDIPNRLTELLPQLSAEVAVLHHMLESRSE